MVLVQGTQKHKACAVAERLRGMGCEATAASEFPRGFYWMADLVLVNSFMDDWVVLKDRDGDLYGRSLHLPAP